MPTLDTRPIVRAVWEDRYHDGNWHCSNCQAIVEGFEQTYHYWAYCYHCGAQMVDMGHPELYPHNYTKPTVTKYMLIRKDEKEPLGYFNTKEEARLELSRRVKTDLANDKFISNIYEILRVEPVE